MATVHIPAEDKTLTNDVELRSYLSSIGITYERWQPAHELAEERRVRDVAPGGDGRLGPRPAGRPQRAPRHDRPGRAHRARARPDPRLDAGVTGRGSRS